MTSNIELIAYTMAGALVAVLSADNLHRKSSGPTKRCLWLLIVIGAAVTISGFRSADQQRHFREAAGDYVIAVRTYHHDRGTVEASQQKTRQAHRKFQSAKRQYRMLPRLHYHSQKVGNMTVTQLDHFLDQRQRLQKQVARDRREYRQQKSGQLTSRYERRNVRHARRQLRHDEKKFFVRHFCNVSSTLKHDRHEPDRVLPK